MFEVKNDKIILYIKAQPNSSKNKISKYSNEMFKVNIKAAAVEGAANKELIKFISKEFKVSKSDIIIKGETSKKKQLILPFREDILKKLKEIK